MENQYDSEKIKLKIENGELKIKGKQKLSKKEPKTPGTVIPKKAPEVVKKPKPKRERKSQVVEYPLDAKINDYGFLHFKNGWLENLGWHKGIALTIDKNADGSVTLTKA